MYCNWNRSNRIYRGTWTKWRIETDNVLEHHAVQGVGGLREANEASIKVEIGEALQKEHKMAKGVKIVAIIDENRDKFIDMMICFEYMCDVHLDHMSVTEHRSQLTSIKTLFNTLSQTYPSYAHDFEKYEID